MHDNVNPDELAFQLMALDVISELLVSSDIAELAKKLTQQLRELTGAKIIMLIRHQAPDRDHLVLHVTPERKKNIFRQAEINLLCPEKSGVDQPDLVAELAPDHPLRLVFAREQIHEGLRFPLKAGGQLIGSLLLFNFEDERGMRESADIISLFSNVIALALKNAIANELITNQAKALAELAGSLEQQVKARTESLQATNQALSMEINERNRVEERMRCMLVEKETLLKEVYHRIKNNMNTIKALLTLQIDAEKDDKVRASLQDAEHRVQSMIVLYERLYCTDNYQELPLREYLEPLTREIVGSFLNHAKVTIETGIGDAILNIRLLTPLGIIVNELVTNMMKYAFTGRDSGVIAIRSELVEGRLKLTIRDDGVGLPEATSLEQSTGFGLNLVKMLSQQINATLRIERDRGTAFHLEFTL